MTGFFFFIHRVQRAEPYEWKKRPDRLSCRGYFQMVRLMRFERTRVAPLPPEDSVSAISPQPHVFYCLIILTFRISGCKYKIWVIRYFLPSEDWNSECNSRPRKVAFSSSKWKLCLGSGLLTFFLPHWSNLASDLKVYSVNWINFIFWEVFSFKPELPSILLLTEQTRQLVSKFSF